MLSRVLSVIVVSILTVPLTAAPALAQDPGDPSAGSPPGVVYQLPLDQGRGDAAPNGKGGADGSGGGGSGAASGSSGEASFYRSENNFGSSSQVPGAGQGGNQAGGASGTSGTSLPTAADIDSGNTSVPETIGLLALIGAVGAGLAFMAVRARRHLS